MRTPTFIPDSAQVAIYGTSRDDDPSNRLATKFPAGRSLAPPALTALVGTATLPSLRSRLLVCNPLHTSHDQLQSSAAELPFHILPSASATAAAARQLHPKPLRSLIPPVAYQTKEQQPLSEVLKNAGRRALGGGIPGAAAMAVQVLTLMWLRTTINYQYRYGMTTTQALKTLYKEGGVVRFYRGLGPALIQGPLSRFGDTAANAGVLALLDGSEKTKDLPVGIKTLAASLSAGGFRIFLMPVDALKTIMQVEGKAGLPALMAKVNKGGPTVLYHGALAASAATFVGHYPWFATYNFLNAKLPQYDELHKKLMRSAVIGFCASAISDTVSNSIRVVKTTRQTATVPMTYPEVVRSVIASDGILGLMGRGLKTKILANGMQGLLFSVLWRLGQDFYNRNEKKE